jgi:hypothetical protein
VHRFPKLPGRFVQWVDSHIGVQTADLQDASGDADKHFLQAGIIWHQTEQLVTWFAERDSTPIGTQGALSSRKVIFNGSMFYSSY